MATATKTRERPILFYAPMVKAILDGRKTVTRRRVKGSADFQYAEKVGDFWRFSWDDSEYDTTESTKRMVGVASDDRDCPYGQPGDRLWVRETWGLHDTEPKDGPDNATVYYRATDGDRHELRYQRWRPSIHMPRWASRITLEVEAVRVERLQEITEEQAVAEGAQCAGVPASLTNRGAFAKLWMQLNGPESWSENPWVWVVEFRRVTE